jgi:hypothetical protein
MKGAALAAMLLVARAAAAEPLATAKLEVSGACELTALESRSNELLGRIAITADARARIAIAVTQDAGAFNATLLFSDEAGAAQPARTISAATCDELAESVAIVVSLVLRQAPPPPAPPPPVVTPPPQDDTTYTPAPAPTKALELGASISSAKQSALVIGGRLDRGRAALGADLELVAPASVDVGIGSVHVLSARLDIAGCWRLRGFAACGLAIGGLVRASGEDLMNARSAVRPVAGLAARVEWRQDLSRRVGLRIFVTGEQLLARPSVLVDEAPVWTYPLRQAALGGGLYFRVP